MKQKIPFWHSESDKDQGDSLYELFKARAEELTINVVRSPSCQEATESIIRQFHRYQAKRVVSSPLRLLNLRDLENKAKSSGLDFSSRLDRKKIERADMGISEFDLGIAELGSIVQDASGLHSRLVSMLPPIHLAILPTAALVKSFAVALEIIENTYKGLIPPYLSFVTGPSKTADIERELTIGVHGPGTLIVLFIDRDFYRHTPAASQPPL